MPLVRQSGQHRYSGFRTGDDVAQGREESGEPKALDTVSALLGGRVRGGTEGRTGPTHSSQKKKEHGRSYLHPPAPPCAQSRMGSIESSGHNAFQEMMWSALGPGSVHPSVSGKVPT